MVKVVKVVVTVMTAAAKRVMAKKVPRREAMATKDGPKRAMALRNII